MEKKVVGTLIVILGFIFVLTTSFVLKEKKRVQNYKEQTKAFKILTGYTKYEVLMLYTKAHEGFSEIWYKDGFVKGRQSYSIGYGINDQGLKSKHKEIEKKYCVNGKTTPMLASQAIKDYYEAHRKYVPSTNLWAELAWELHYYNRGQPKKLFLCCSKTRGIGCGSKNKDINESHTERRLFEKAVYERNINEIKRQMELCKKKLQKK